MDVGLRDARRVRGFQRVGELVGEDGRREAAAARRTDGGHFGGATQAGAEHDGRDREPRLRPRELVMQGDRIGAGGAIVHVLRATAGGGLPTVEAGEQGCVLFRTCVVGHEVELDNHRCPALKEGDRIRAHEGIVGRDQHLRESASVGSSETMLSAVR